MTNDKYRIKEEFNKRYDEILKMDEETPFLFEDEFYECVLAMTNEVVNNKMK